MATVVRVTDPTLPSQRPVDSTVQNYVTDPTKRPYSIVGEALRARVQQGSPTVDANGTIIALSGTVDVQGSGNSDNEYAGLFCVVRLGTTAKPVTGRAWVADTGVHGPIGQQADLLSGITGFLNNYHPSSPKQGPAVSFTAVTKPGAGPAAHGAGHDTAATYPADYGFAVVGHSSGSNIGWRVGFRAGGAASGWMTPQETSLLGKGAEFTDYTQAGLHVHSPATPDAPAAILDGPVIVQGRNLLAEIDALKQQVADLQRQVAARPA